MTDVVAARVVAEEDTSGPPVLALMRWVHLDRDVEHLFFARIVNSEAVPETMRSFLVGRLFLEYAPDFDRPVPLDVDLDAAALPTDGTVRKRFRTDSEG